MTRTEVAAFLESGCDELSPVVPFGRGQISELNSRRDREYPIVWLDDEQLSSRPVLTSNNLPIDAWNIVLHIKKLDQTDSVETDYTQLVDDCDYIGQQLIKKYNAIVEGYTLVTITGISRAPDIKKQADHLTGIILAFTLNVPDTTNLCP